MSALVQQEPRPELTAQVNPEVEQLDEILLDILFSNAEKFVIATNLAQCPK